MNQRTTTSKQFDVDLLQQQLDTRFLGVGDRVVFLPIVDSTNTQAMALARTGLQEGVVVLTDSQTAGKGRLGRRWVDRSGLDVLSSTLLRPLFPPYLLVMIASLAVVDAIAETSTLHATIKWPNDVLVRDRKIAGILIETSHDFSGRTVAIVGIGVNVNGQLPPFSESEGLQENRPLGARATTLEAECGRPLCRETFVAHLLRSLETRYLALQQEAREAPAMPLGLTSHSIRAQWRSQLSTLGRTIEVRQGDALISGIAEDVDDSGELLLRRLSGDIVTITWGDIGYPTE